MPAERVRVSLRELQYKYDNGDRAPLENLIRAFRHIQKLEPKYDLPPEEDDSFFRTAGFHGEPFEGPGRYDSSWWGGYCHHNDVLFPAWHRAYLLHLENALRRVPNCGDVTIPFWDETWDALNEKTGNPLPAILTTPQFPLDDETHNPLYSYKLTKALAEDIAGDQHHRYSKHQGYETVRYPLSGLVGTPKDVEETEAHNSKYSDQTTCTDILNANVNSWLSGTVVIDKSRDDPNNPRQRYPDTSSVLSRFEACLKAPTYTAFSNNRSMDHYQKEHAGNPEYIVSIESPHNAMHLAVGGFTQKDRYNANPIFGAQGDMGDNETAAFDPIFFLHHSFVDYVFSLWQKKHNLTETGKITIDAADPGARSKEGSVGYAPGAQLETTSPLVPFSYVTMIDGKKEKKWHTVESITDITQIGYEYGAGSLDMFVNSTPALWASQEGTFTKYKATHQVDRSQFAGSFVIRTYATTPKRGRVEIDREPVLSRWNLSDCGTCQGRLMTRSITPVSKELEAALLEGEDEGTEIKYHAHAYSRMFDEEANAPWGWLTQGPRIEVGDL